MDSDLQPIKNIKRRRRKIKDVINALFDTPVAMMPLMTSHDTNDVNPLSPSTGSDDVDAKCLAKSEWFNLGQAPASKSAIRRCFMGFLHRGFPFLFLFFLNAYRYSFWEPRHDRPFIVNSLLWLARTYDVCVLFVNGLPSISNYTIT